jgi:hypothetical protein
MTFGELTSGESSAFGYESCQTLGMVPGNGTEVLGIYI